ncbi:hypothetical protein H5410_040739 [Solanum commersonii]|uniref:Uncharacterized protein n=1 Tax=Solanum commersonii TaxID=4109 RepID=A0A9J5XPT6_SOLCO|nr:hypothetical protein H5410_040739 [Solanum commersonii]
MNINTITLNNVIELLKEVTDNTLREKIIQLAVNNKASSSNIVDKSKNEFEYSSPYSLSEQKHVDSLQLELFSMNIFDTLRSTKRQATYPMRKGKIIPRVMIRIFIRVLIELPNFTARRHKFDKL